MKPSQFIVTKQITIASIFSLLALGGDFLLIGILPENIGTFIVSAVLFITTFFAILGAQIASFKINDYIYRRTSNDDVPQM